MKKFFPKKQERRRGVVLVYVTGSLFLFIGAAGLAIDIGLMYTRRAQAQRAADAAALACAYPLSFIDGGTAAKAEEYARTYAMYNGYTNGINDTTVSIETSIAGQPQRVRVTVRRPQDLLFAKIFGFNKANIGASATAVYSPAVIDIPVPTADYGRDLGGTNGPAYNYSIYGPYSNRNNGDNLSTILNNDGTLNTAYQAPNDAGNNTQGGYNFILKTGNMQGSQVQVELFDPDTWNQNKPDGSVEDYTSSITVDEIRGHNPLGPTPSSRYTTTQFSLYSDNGTPSNFADDVLISRQSYGGTSASDMQWVTPTGFTFNKYPDNAGLKVNYRLNVATTDGSSENGFAIRLGPPRAAGAAFDPNNGTSVAVRDIIPVNFNVDGAATVPLGFVSRAAAGGNIKISKFDTDVPSQSAALSVYYTSDTYSNPNPVPPGIPAGAFPGAINDTSGVFSEDVISLPATYQGGNWTAYYVGGGADTSTWRLTASGSSPGTISLIR